MIAWDAIGEAVLVGTCFALLMRGNQKLDRVLLKLGVIQREAKTMANTSQEQLDLLIAAVAEEDGEIDSAIALIDGIPALIASAGTDPIKITELIHLVRAKSDALKAAILAAPPLPYG